MKERPVGTEQLEKIKATVADALAGDPVALTIDLSTDEFDELGVALDEITVRVESHGYQLTVVRAIDDGWVATYSKPPSQD